MCGRYVLTHEERALEAMLKVALSFYLKPRYNIAPTQPIPIARTDLDTKKREIAYAYWGLIPSWTKDPSIGTKMINARAETLREKPSFRGLYKLKRCLIPASGFYEWKQIVKGKKTPHYIKMLDDSLFAFAGLWDTYLDPGGAEVDTVTIITTKANEIVGELHERMPVIVPREKYNQWLDADNQTAKGLDSILAPYPADEMTYYPVSTEVNSAARDEPSFISPTSLFG
ncbi:Putative SOS response-associated peptidase YedK [Poriferisphaera corsica]|uniref:Abasic site processing protein n=1 Tax=Poriferisphaera corsica TaxID=2528020 RepID=A0A517YQ99_9BACT|nr:SOS response-associated peptidase [Poriferisphaera corsica]QDU32380.1 Putative SOS response-associated peptidase YedK [Poriferisphaera corsica]